MAFYVAAPVPVWLICLSQRESPFLATAFILSGLGKKQSLIEQVQLTGFLDAVDNLGKKKEHGWKTNMVVLAASY